MKVRIAVAILVAVFIGLLAIQAWARPSMIKCPIDGQPMTFEHQAGFGKDSVCWYAHEGSNPHTGAVEHHEVYLNCGD